MPFTNDWSTTYRGSPVGADDPRQVDDRIRDFKLAVEERATRELFWTASVDMNKHGQFRMGAGRAYVGNYSGSWPTTRPDGSTSLDADDKGRLAFDSSSLYLPRVRGSAAWVGFMRELARWSMQGSLSAPLTNCVPCIVFPRACTLIKTTARVRVAPTTNAILIDINRNGVAANSVFAGKTRITIAAGTYSDSRTSFHSTYGVFSAEHYATLDIDQTGGSTTGSDLSLTLEVSL